MIQTIQTAFASTPAPAASLSLPLAQPSTVGNTLSVHLRFSPLTGTPVLADNFGNRYRVTAATTLPSGEAVASLTADVVRGGAGHTITVTSQGGQQNLEASVTEFSAVGPTQGERHSSRDILLAVLLEEQKQTSLLTAIAKAERAIT